MKMERNLEFLKKITIILVAFSYLFLSIFFVHSLLSKEGMIGLRGDWNVPHYTQQYKNWFSNGFFYWWTRNLGGVHHNIIDYPNVGFLTLLSVFGFSGEFISKLIIVISLFASGCSMYFLARTFKLEKEYSYLAGLFYMTTPILFNTIVNGWINFMFSYALTPLWFASFITIFQERKRNYRKIVISGIILSIITLQINFWLLVSILSFSYFLFTLNCDKSRILEKCIRFFLIIFIVLLLQAHFIIPTFMDFGSSTSFAESSITGYWKTLRAPVLINAFSLFGGGYTHFAKTGIMFGTTWIFARFIILIVIFSALILRPKDKYVQYFAFMALSTIFILKSINSPFSDVNMFLYENFTFFMSFIRDIQYITVIVAIFYALLIGLSSREIITLLSKKNDVLRNIRDHHFLEKSFIIVVWVLIAVIILFNSRPFLTGDFGGNIQIYQLDTVYKDLYYNISSDKEDNRILWSPLAQPMTYNNSKYPGYDPLLRGAPKPYIGNTMGTKYELFVSMLLHLNKTTYLGEILGQSNVKYIILRNDFESKLPNFLYRRLFPEIWTNKHVEDVLNIQNDLSLEKTLNNGIIRIYKNDNFIPHIYTSNEIWLSNDYSDYVSLAYAKPVINKTKEIPLMMELNVNNDLKEQVSTIVLDCNGYSDIVTLFLSPKYTLDISRSVGLNYDALIGWVKSADWWWYDWRLSTMTENGIFTLNPNSTIKIPFELDVNKEYELQIKTSCLDKSGAIELYLNEKSIAILDVGLESNWYYLKLPPLDKRTNYIKIRNINGENIIYKLVIAPKKSIENAENSANKFLEYKKLIIIKELEYNPTKKVIFNLIIDKSWNFNPYQYDTLLNSSLNNLNYSFSKKENIAILTANFIGSKNVDEFITLSKPISYDLGEYPYFAINYSVDNSDLQFIQIGFGMDFDDDGKLDKNIFSPPDTETLNNTKTFSLDALKLVTANYPNEKYYKLVNIKILAHKNWETESLNENTNFYFSDIEISSLNPYGNLKLDSSFSQGRYSYFNSNQFDMSVPINIPQEGEYNIFLRASGKDNITFEDKNVELDGLKWHKLDNTFFVDNLSILTLNKTNNDTLNVAFNSDFESIDDKWRLSYWVGKNATENYVTIAHNGKHSIEIDAYQGIYSLDTSHNKRTKLNYGAQYHLSAWVKSNNYLGDVILMMPLYNNKGEWINDNWIDIIYLNGSSDWIKLEGIFTVPEYIESGYIRLQTGSDDAYADGNVLFDNVVLTEISRPLKEPIKFDAIVLVRHADKKSEYVNPIVSFQKINPTKYIVQINNASTPFFLIFSESFHHDWKALINGNDDETVPEENHFVANGFANGWYINKTGNYTITIEFMPQRLYELGLKISLSTFIILLLLLLIPERYLRGFWRRNRKKNNENGATAMNAAPKNIMLKAISAIKNIFRAKDSEMAPLKEYVEHKKYDYEFKAQKKVQHEHTAPALKEVEKKLEDIKERLMKHDKKSDSA